MKCFNHYGGYLCLPRSASVIPAPEPPNTPTEACPLGYEPHGDSCVGGCLCFFFIWGGGGGGVGGGQVATGWVIIKFVWVYCWWPQIVRDRWLRLEAACWCNPCGWEWVRAHRRQDRTGFHTKTAAAFFRSSTFSEKNLLVLEDCEVFIWLAWDNKHDSAPYSQLLGASEENIVAVAWNSRAVICQSGWMMLCLLTITTFYICLLRAHTDVDECEREEHDCQPSQECINTLGAFTCQCPDGYRKVATECIGENIFIPSSQNGLFIFRFCCRSELTNLLILSLRLRHRRVQVQVLPASLR